MNPKLNLIASVLFITLAGGLMVNLQAHATNKDSGGYCVISRVPPDKIPFPRAYDANTVFELAADETYILNGTIVSVQGQAYFQIDFNSQPWAATKARLANPYFELNQSESLADQYRGQMVQMAVVARQVKILSTNPAQNNLSLDLIVAPQYLK
jgi:hypothetical protein